MRTSIQYTGDDQRDPETIANAGSKPIQRPDPLVKVDDIAYVMFEKPDLTRQTAFLEDFGMQRLAGSGDTAYFRGNGSSPWFYSASKGSKSRYLGAGFVARTEDDLNTICAATGQPIEDITEPGGGKRVRLHDPDGFVVDIVHGRETVQPTPYRDKEFPFNTPANKTRVNARVTSETAPCPLERLGHFVLAVTDFETSHQWYMRHLGVIPTDVQTVRDGSPVLAFNRCDRGDQPADHHTVVIVQNFAPGCMHSAYETFDLDAIGQGNQHLKSKGWDHYWGIGRHILGSQLFDYWKDPFGDELEHYADGDVFDASHPTEYHPFDQGSLWSWGEDVPLAPKPGLGTILKLLFAKKDSGVPRKVLLQMGKALGIKPRPWY